MNNTPKEDAVVELLTLTYEIADSGNKYYYNKEGKLHRIYGPAIIRTDGTEFWYKNGKRHREDGPAITHLKYSSEVYIINGETLSKEKFTRWKIKNQIKKILNIFKLKSYTSLTSYE